MKIVVFESEQREARAFDPLKAIHEVVLEEGPLKASDADRYADAQVISTFIYSDLSRRVVDQLPALRMIATRSTGFDHIDVARCAERGIVVSNVPNYGENTVAEHVFALLLAISHRLVDAVERTRQGSFSPDGLQGFDLQGKTLGVIGTGSIGRHVIAIAKGFRMDVVAHDVSADAALAERLGFRYLPFDDVLAQSDVLTLHAPGASETYHLISKKELSRMKDGAVLINTARGSLVDAGALVQALVSGKLAAAGLDVLPEEPIIREEAELICSIFCREHDLRDLVADHMLLRMSNVVVTPHSAFNTREAVERIVLTTVSNILAFLEERPTNVVAGGEGDVDESITREAR